MLRQQLMYMYVDTKEQEASCNTHKRLDGCWKPNCRVPIARLWMVDYAIR